MTSRIKNRRDAKAENFDPLGDLLIAQTSKPEDLKRINFRVLSPFQRALLVIDGTVTKFIEAYTMEPVEVVRLSQSTRHLPNKHIWLDAPEGTEIITREVLLQGKYSHYPFAYAASLVIPKRLPNQSQAELEMDGEGLGRILLKSRMETLREILWYGMEKPKSLPPQINHLLGSDFLSRTYRIIANNHPLMLINEKFPFEGDNLPAHH